MTNVGMAFAMPTLLLFTKSSTFYAQLSNSFIIFALN